MKQQLTFKSRIVNSHGASLTEFVLLISLVAVVSIGAVTEYGFSTGESFCQSGSAIADSQEYGRRPVESGNQDHVFDRETFDCTQANEDFDEEEEGERNVPLESCPPFMICPSGG